LNFLIWIRVYQQMSAKLQFHENSSVAFELSNGSNGRRHGRKYFIRRFVGMWTGLKMWFYTISCLYSGPNRVHAKMWTFLRIVANMYGSLNCYRDMQVLRSFWVWFESSFPVFLI
jgi:hypothetical protein